MFFDSGESALPIIYIYYFMASIPNETNKFLKNLTLLRSICKYQRWFRS